MRRRPLQWRGSSLDCREDFGLTLSALEGLYATQYRAVKEHKDGADVFFTRLQSGSAAPGTYVGLRTWTTDVAPTSIVVQVNLHRSDPPVP